MVSRLIFWLVRSLFITSHTPSHQLTILFVLETTSKISKISSPTHPIEISDPTQNSAQIALANQDNSVPLLQNFDLSILLAEPNKFVLLLILYVMVTFTCRPVFRVQEKVGMLALYPDLIREDEDPITEMVFIVDRQEFQIVNIMFALASLSLSRSGSMSGSKIQKTKDMLQVFMRSLPLGTLFNVCICYLFIIYLILGKIVGFGTNFVKLFPDSKEYDDSSLTLATNHVCLLCYSAFAPLYYCLRFLLPILQIRDLGANLGGTNLLLPLKDVLSSKPRDGTLPFVFFFLSISFYFSRNSTENFCANRC